NPSTKIKFTIQTPPVSSPLIKGRTKEGFVSLKVYDILGNEVATLVNEVKPAGIYEVEFNATSHSGKVRNLPSGLYFYTLTTGGYSQTKKMILLK
ncbi:MAG: T9SS type A sorting domain-containing protein, partial [Desulfobacterales bacterium]